MLAELVSLKADMQFIPPLKGCGVSCSILADWYLIGASTDSCLSAMRMLVLRASRLIST
jgi:hypothetical protein